MTRVPSTEAVSSRPLAEASSAQLPAGKMAKSKQVTALSSGWEFKNSRDPDSKFRSVAQFPTNVHLDLMHHKLIPDPFLEKNELLVQWVGEEDWVYRTILPEVSTGRGQRTHLVFEGLDTHATVTFNGKEVLKADNMFVPYRVDVTDLLDEHGNELSILFESTFLKGKAIQKDYPQFPWGCWNGDCSRLAVRKAQYHYGWDWGPTLLTCGPWKDVYLETFIDRITDLYFTTDVPESNDTASIDITAEIDRDGEKVVFQLTSPDGERVMTTSGAVSDGKAIGRFEVEKPELWYPAGYGAQPLYNITAVLDDTADFASKKLGLRRAVVVQRELKNSPGESFFFEINGVPVFAAGVNWIPADNFLPRLDAAKYERWLKLVTAGNGVMIRVWGGGIYEHPSFYETCDKLGIMVWQDFMFACGNYPAVIPEFRDAVEKEAIANVKRLRHHPSIVLYAGNNEDYSYMASITGRLGYDPTQTEPEDWLKTGFPARYLYEKLLPAVVEKYSNKVHYHRGSPYGTVETPEGIPSKGDIHQWNVWHGTIEPYQSYPKLAGRFVSEFGMEAYPSIRTIDAYLPTDSERVRYSQSDVVEFHNKAEGAAASLGHYLADNIKANFSPIENYIYDTQLLQSEAISAAYRGWRRNWQGPGKEYTAGALVWQINDCWPVTSWALVDFYYRPKMAFWTVKRELEKVVVGTQRATKKTPADRDTNAHIKLDYKLQIWVSSFLLEPVKTTKVVAKAFDIATGKKLAEETVAENVEIPSNGAIEFDERNLPGWDGEPRTDINVVVSVQLLDSKGKEIAKATSWPEPLKYLAIAEKPGLSVNVEGEKFTATTEKPVKGALMEIIEGDDDTVVFSDNGFDVMPGETVKGTVTGLNGAKIGLRHLGMLFEKEERKLGKGVWYSPRKH